MGTQDDEPEKDPMVLSMTVNCSFLISKSAAMTAIKPECIMDIERDKMIRFEFTMNEENYVEVLGRMMEDTFLLNTIREDLETSRVGLKLQENCTLHDFLKDNLIWALNQMKKSWEDQMETCEIDFVPLLGGGVGVINSVNTIFRREPEILIDGYEQIMDNIFTFCDKVTVDVRITGENLKWVANFSNGEDSIFFGRSSMNVGIEDKTLDFLEKMVKKNITFPEKVALSIFSNKTLLAKDALCKVLGTVFGPENFFVECA